MRMIESDKVAPLVRLLLMKHPNAEAIIQNVNDIVDRHTIDAVPVVHGEWFFTEYEYFDCSVCGECYYNGCDSSYEARKELENGNTYSYCPFCGAKMDGERKGDDGKPL